MTLSMNALLSKDYCLQITSKSVPKDDGKDSPFIVTANILTPRAPVHLFAVPP